MVKSNKREFYNVFAMMLMACMMFSILSFFAPSIAFCEETGSATDQAASVMVDVGNKLATQIYGTIRKVITPLAIVIFACAGCQFIFGGTRGFERAKVLVGCGFAAILLVAFAPLIGQEVSGWVSSFGGGDLSQYNNLK